MLTQLKNGLDESDGTESISENSDRNNLHRIVFHYLKNMQIRQSKLEFFKPYDVTSSLLDDEQGEGSLPLQQLVMSHIRKEGDLYKEKRKSEEAALHVTFEGEGENGEGGITPKGKHNKRQEKERLREEMRVEVQKIEKAERRGKRFKIVTGIFDLLVHGADTVFPNEALFPGARVFLERIVASQKVSNSPTQDNDR